MSERTFPTHPEDRHRLPTLPWNVPWDFVLEHERQALANHDQTVARLAERGGLSWTELYFVILDAKYAHESRSGSSPLYKARMLLVDVECAIRVLEKIEEWERRRREETPA